MVRRFNPSIRGKLKVVPGRWYSTTPVCDFTYCYGGDWALGKVGNYSLGFPDNDDPDPAAGVVVPDDASIQFGDSDDFSVACWVKSKDATTGVAGYVSKMVGTGGWTLGRWTGDKFAFSLRDGSHAEAFSDDAYQDTDWHYLVGTRNGTTKVATLYVDGVAQAITTTVAINDSGADLVIGRWYQDDDTYHADAYIDEVAIWDVALTSTEIAALYNSGNGARSDSITPPEVSPGVTGSLVLYYDFEIGNSNPDSGNFFALNNATSASVYDVDTVAWKSTTMHTGTMTNMSVADFGAWGQGKLGKYSFLGDGVDGGIIIASSSYLPLGDGNESFSISLWANNTDALNSYETLVGRHSTNESGDAFTDGYNLQYDGGGSNNLTFTVGEWTNASDHASCTWAGSTNTTFRHLVVTYDKDANVSQVWLNGVKGTDGTKSTASPLPGTGDTRIGVLSTGTPPLPVASYSWPGNIDEVAFYNVSLDSGAIAELYNSGNGARASTVSSSALVCYLDMECNGPGTLIAKDLSTNDLSGTLTNADAGTCGAG